MESLGPWLFASVALIVVAALIYRFPKPTLIALATVVVLAVAAGLMLSWYGSESSRQYREKRARAESLITKDQVDISDWRIAPGQGVWTIEGTLINKSQHTIDSIDLLTRVYLCNDGEQCPAIAEREHTLYLEVPPGQARPVRDFVSFTPNPTIPNSKDGWRVDGGIQRIIAKVE